MRSSLVVLRGLPGAGKTTFARSWTAKDPYNKRISREDLRRMTTFTPSSRDCEDLLFSMERALAKLLVAEGYNVLVDDCNLSLKTRQAWEDTAFECGAKIVVKDFTDVPLEECIRRDAGRTEPVGASTITRMYEQYLKGKSL